MAKRFEGQSLQQYVQRVVNEGLYLTEASFHQEQENLQELIQYIERLSPNMGNLEKAFKMIKFYRFPILVAFRFLYQRMNKLPESHRQPLIELSKQIAAYVASILEVAQIKIFEEIKFIFEWGRSKKRWKMSITPKEIQYIQFVYEISKEKKKMLESVRKEIDNDLVDKIMENLDDLELKRKMLFFEKRLVDYIKESTLQEIQNKMAKQTLKEEFKLLPAESQKKQKYEPVYESSPVKEQVRYQQKHPKILYKQKKEEHQPEQQDLPLEKQKQQPICCRQYFMKDEVIEQSQNLKIQYKHYRYPFVSNYDERPSKEQKIKKTLCGFLNSEGGTIFFGVKENVDTKKRSIMGYHLSEKRKLQFRADIFDFLKDVRPDVGKMCTIKWVPIKSKQTLQFGSGLFVPKVIIEKGIKEQLYSYVQGNVQKFAFKTQNQFLIENDAQKILKIFSNRLRNPERTPYKIHDHPCKEPLRGKPVYQQRSPHSYEPQEQMNQFPTIYEQKKEKYAFQNQQIPYKQHSQQATASKYIIQGMTASELKVSLQDTAMEIYKQLQQKTLLVTIYNKQGAAIFFLNNPKLRKQQVHSQVKCSMDENNLINDIIKEIKMQDGMEIIVKDNNCNIWKFKKLEIAAKFWLKMRQLGLKVEFIQPKID